MRNPPLNARNDRVGVGPLLRPIISLLDHHHLLPCLSAGEDDGDFAGLVDWR